MKTMTITIERNPLTITFDGQQMQVEELSIRLPFGRKPSSNTIRLNSSFLQKYTSTSIP